MLGGEKKPTKSQALHRDSSVLLFRNFKLRFSKHKVREMVDYLRYG